MQDKAIIYQALPITPVKLAKLLDTSYANAYNRLTRMVKNNHAIKLDMTGEYVLSDLGLSYLEGLYKAEKLDWPLPNVTADNIKASQYYKDYESGSLSNERALQILVENAGTLVDMLLLCSVLYNTDKLEETLKTDV